MTAQFKELQNKYESLKENDHIFLNHDQIECVVISQHKDDCIFLQRVDDHSKHFHIFYDELCDKDHFEKVTV